MNRYVKSLLVLLPLLLLLGSACTVATRTAEVGGPATVSSEKLSVDPAIKVGRLDNGLTYFILENGRPEQRAELRLVVNAGSILEDDDQRGLAHFVEHMAFNGTRNFAKQELVEFLELIGMRFGPDINAYTSFDETVYMLTIPTDDAEIVDKAFLILEDWAHGVSFEGDEIDKERGVVLEERRLGRGANMRMLDKQFPIILKDSLYAERLPIGQEEILKEAPYERLKSFYRDWYRPDLMAVIAVGDFEAEAIEKKIREQFSGLTNPKKTRPRAMFPVPDHDETLFAIATDPEATSNTVAVYYKLDKSPQGSRADYRRGLVEQLYQTMLNDRLDELRQQSDPPFLFAVSQKGQFVRARDVYFQTAAVREGGIERGLEVLLTELERVDRHGFTATELERVKKDLLRQAEQAYRERDKVRSGSHASEIARHFLSGEPVPGIAAELEMMKEYVPAIDIDELNGLARSWITEHNRVITVNAPEKEGLHTPTDEELLAVFRGAEGKTIEAYVDKVRDEPLFSGHVHAGTIERETHLEPIGVTHWQLSNGVEVVLKPTDFKNDEILLRGFSLGGHSLVDDERYVSAAFADGVVREGGLGEFDKIELEKALAGKVAGASLQIGELTEEVRGNASPEDLETMFQLVYLSFTAPRKDAEAVQAWGQRMRGFIENRLSRPETVFGDEWMLKMYDGHPRRQPLSEEMLDRVDLDEAFEVYRDRVADAGDFTFVLVGNFEPDEIKPLVATYLGGLPTTGREESWRDVGTTRPQEALRFEVQKGLEEKSQVRLSFLGDAPWSRQAQHDISSLAALFRIRLREILREDKGATYGVGVFGGISREPRERYSFTVSFGCAPDNVEELTQAVFDDIAKLKSTPPDESNLQKVREGQTRRRETDLKENGFWLGQLVGAYRYEQDPLLILEYDALVENVTAERLQAAAGRYLDTERYLLGVLNPEPQE